MREMELLSRAEMRVAVLAARGCSNREMAAQLCVSVNTVKSHVSRILQRTGAHNKAHMVAMLMVDERFRRAAESPVGPLGPTHEEGVGLRRSVS